MPEESTDVARPTRAPLEIAELRFTTSDGEEYRVSSREAFIETDPPDPPNPFDIDPVAYRRLSRHQRRRLIVEFGLHGIQRERDRSAHTYRVDVAFQREGWPPDRWDHDETIDGLTEREARTWVDGLNSEDEYDHDVTRFRATITRETEIDVVEARVQRNVE